MKNMSFSMTVLALLCGYKTVTRRLRWIDAQAGDRVMAVDKGMGLGKNGAPWRMGVIEFTDVRREPLSAITEEDVAREGFPGKSAPWFIDRFMAAMGCSPNTAVTRIEFRPVALAGTPAIGTPVVFGRRTLTEGPPHGHFLGIVPAGVHPNQFVPRVRRILGEACHDSRIFSQVRDWPSFIILANGVLEQVSYIEPRTGPSLHRRLFEDGLNVGQPGGCLCL